MFAFGIPGEMPIAGNWDGQPLMLPPTATPTSTPVSPPPMNANFVYDGDGKRVKSIINGTTTYFVGAHYEVANGVVTKYYYAGAQRIAMRTNGALKFLLGDHLGSTSLVTDANGQNTIETRYTAWGEVRYASGNMPTKYQYTGQFSYEMDRLNGTRSGGSINVLNGRSLLEQILWKDSPFQDTWNFLTGANHP